uniref:Uncharacterized protein LOC105033678 n=1 Tax=Elaeis guineensis var. tenera TaxID=51953 RepID=A0A6I9QDE1_ELAGV|nr:uncharacterized protein LOC105033678 [Elaeis guineensis]
MEAGTAMEEEKWVRRKEREKGGLSMRRDGCGGGHCRRMGSWMGLEEEEDEEKWMRRKGRSRERQSAIRNGLEDEDEEKRMGRKKRGKVEGATMDKEKWVAIDFKIMYENMAYLSKNKEAMDANLIILQEEKESELIAKLKNQLEEKLKLLKEKNQNLLDLQQKINEQEMKIFDLVTPKVTIDMGIKRDPKPPTEAVEGLAKEADQESIGVKVTDAIIAEPITTVPPIITEASKATKESEPITVIEPTAIEVAKES